MRKIKTYFTLIIILLTPKKLALYKMRKLYEQQYLSATPSQKYDIDKRVNYYNKVKFNKNPQHIQQYKIGSFKKGRSWSYYIDMKELLSYFDDNLLFDYLPGDIQTVPKNPTFVKSRPIVDNNDDSILLKLNKARHYKFIIDNKSYDTKKDLLVWRGNCHQPHRQFFIERYHNHKLCDVGDVRKNMVGSPFHKPFMRIKEQLDYKFILSIEGNDVATNLKWIMSSNSVCFMTQPKFETWFMEGTLIAGKHYVQVKEDYSDLQNKILYYLNHSNEAKNIIKNANEHVEKFKNSRREKLTSFLVIQKYFLTIDDLDLNPTTKSIVTSENL